MQNIDTINTVIRNRRSVFPKQLEEGRQIPREIIEQVLTNAGWAPSHGNLQPWKFVVFTGKGLQKLATFQSKLYRETSGEKFKETTFETLRSNPLRASHVIAICMKRDPNKKFPEVEEVCATAAAVQNIYLSISAFGLGGYWTTGGITYNEKAKPFFGLGEDDKLLGFFYAGYVAVPSPDKTRAAIEEKVEWVEE